MQLETALDGTAETSLPPGTYTLRSVEPLEFQGKTYRWEVQLTLSRADISVGLNNGNAITTDIEVVESPAVADHLPALFERLKNSVVTIISEFGQGTGFLIDPAGLLLTNAHVVQQSEYLAAQFDDRRKVRVTLLTSDVENDLAILWINPAAFPEAIVAPIGSPTPLAVGQAVFTVGNPLDQERVLTSGLISRVEATRIVSDINTNPGNSGGPLFNSTGEVIGVTTFVSQGGIGPGLSGVVRIEEAMPLLEQAKTRREGFLMPSTSLLPVIPSDPYPADALKALAVGENVNSDPYVFSVDDFDVTIFTPTFLYRINASEFLRVQREQQKRKAKRGAPGSDLTKPWEVAAERGNFKPLTIIHIAPKTRQKFWASWGASTGDKNVSVKEFKTDFYRMNLLCAGKEVEPVVPGRTPVAVDDRSGDVRITDSTYLGWYSYLPSAITPDCAKMTIEIFADKNVPPVTKVLGKSTVHAVWNDFTPYRQAMAGRREAERSGSEPDEDVSLQTFVDINADLMNLGAGSAAWADYDNDGDLDILVTGLDGSVRYSKIYRNDDNRFVDIKTRLEPVSHGSSAVWGDYDNDNDLDILLAGRTGEDLSENLRTTKLYRNDGGRFVDTKTDLFPLSGSSAAWGDYDNDGDLDVLVTGWDGTSRGVSTKSKTHAKLYRNDHGRFVAIATGLSGVTVGTSAWGDYDNDGDLDIVIAGWDGEAYTATVYQNFDGRFLDIDARLTGVQGGTVAWGDYDNDGDVDILLTGRDGDRGYAKVYRNDGGRFVDINARLTGVDQSGAAWGDYDNDGDLDILVTGREGRSTPHSRVYRNDRGSFVDIGAELMGVHNQGGVAWGDYDNDGDLDILLTGMNDRSFHSKVYRNESGTVNTAPTIPVNLSSSMRGGEATLSWNPSTDAQTAQNSLTYNLWVGTTPDGVEIVSPAANLESGHRTIPGLGNVSHHTTWTIKNLPPGTYYWSVQAIDNGFVGSAFAPAGTFIISANSENK